MNKIHNLYMIKSFESTNHRRKIYSSKAELTGNGKEDVSRFARLFVDERIEKIISSPQPNNVETVKIICAKMGLEWDDSGILADFDQINLGQWDGLTESDIKNKWPQEYHSIFHKPDFNKYYIAGGSENFNDIKKRVKKGLIYLKELNLKGVLLIAHREIINMILLLMLNLPDDKLWCFKQDNGGVTSITIDDSNEININYINRVLNEI